MPEDEDEDDLAVHPRIHHHSRTPVYVQVANLIEEYIRESRLRVDDRLPPERDLADEYRVAHGTVRRALEELRDRRVVETVHGRGTYVVRVPPARK